MRSKLTQAFVKKASAVPGSERSIYWDTTLAGFGLMVTSAGHRSWVVQYRAAGTSRRLTIKGSLSLAKAKQQARRLQGLVADGRDPVADKRKAEAVASNSLKAIAETYLTREARGLRSIGERRRIFERYLYPRLGARQIDSIRRSEIVKLLDQVEDENGPVMADHVLAALRRLMTWHASRSDGFNSPITRGMSRTSPRERARDRVLSDDELRAVWKATQDWASPYAHLVRFILLTTTRLREAAQMRRQEVTGDAWVIPAARHKSKREFLLPLSEAAREALEAAPIIGSKGWTFTGNGERPINGFGKAKAQLDARVLAVLRQHDPKAQPLPRWTTHDLRRSGRSLMSRAGVPVDHAERCLGHVIAGVRGTYDRHEYANEKRQAFEALAALVARILEPPDANVVELRREV